MGSPRRGQPRVTWAMIRWVTAARVCGSGVSGTLSMMVAVRYIRKAAAVWLCRLPGDRVSAPILRLRYQGSADQWAIGIYLASSDRYTEFELPTSFGPKTGTPEEGVDDTFILYAGPKTGH